MPIIRRAIQGIGAGIGLASEAIAHHKERSKSSDAGVQVQQKEITKEASNENLEKTGTNDSSSDSEIEEEKILNNDEAEWALDEAAAELEARFGPPPAYTYDDEKLPADPNVTGGKTNPTTERSDVTTFQPLPLPVIIPQRRPHSAARGFVRAYAPLLESCAGIKQNEFISFLNALDKSAETSPIFTVINVAAFAIGFIPDPIVMGVTTAVQIVNGTAQELVSRRGRNTFLDKMNKEMFMPKGLFCMIMAFRPEMADQAVLNGDLSATDKALVKFASADDTSAMMQGLRSIRMRSGVSKGEFTLPEQAPLVFPALDAAAATTVTDVSKSGVDPSFQESIQTKFKSSSDFINTYLDRRARDTYAGTYSTSKLVKSISGDTEASKPYASRYSDPNHAANSGTLLGLVTGGRFDPISSKRVWKAERRARRRGLPGLTEEERRNVILGRREGVGYGAGATRKQMRRQQGTERGIVVPAIRKTIRRVMRPDVLYLTVVNLPSESEMHEMKQLLESKK